MVSFEARRNIHFRMANYVFCPSLYTFNRKKRGFDEIGAIFLAAVAESTNTPLSLLALALTVSCFCKHILAIAECIVGGQRGQRFG